MGTPCGCTPEGFQFPNVAVMPSPGPLEGGIMKLVFGSANMSACGVGRPEGRFPVWKGMSVVGVWPGKPAVVVSTLVPAGTPDPGGTPYWWITTGAGGPSFVVVVVSSLAPALARRRLAAVEWRRRWPAWAWALASAAAPRPAPRPADALDWECTSAKRAGEPEPPEAALRAGDGGSPIAESRDEGAAAAAAVASAARGLRRAPFPACCRRMVAPFASTWGVGWSDLGAAGDHGWMDAMRPEKGSAWE
mmetsp:Transcript_24591/g.92944  ORF Transcript_24591/g.92944 Transcript_24591/m.92944 type:complete len:248 (-) Transcript_24591:826-1569(-)